MVGNMYSVKNDTLFSLSRRFMWICHCPVSLYCLIFSVIFVVYLRILNRQKNIYIYGLRSMFPVIEMDLQCV